VIKLANLGAQQAIGQNPGIAEGVNTLNGHLTYKAVADNQSREYTNISQLELH